MWALAACVRHVSALCPSCGRVVRHASVGVRVKALDVSVRYRACYVEAVLAMIITKEYYFCNNCLEPMLV